MAHIAPFVLISERHLPGGKKRCWTDAFVSIKEAINLCSGMNEGGLKWEISCTGHIGIR